jgi:hypothetical protein
MTRATANKQQAQALPAFAEPGFYFETLKDGEVVDSKFQNLRLALESIEAWPTYEHHKASIRLAKYA